MDILYLLVPLSIVLVLAIIGVLAWAIYNGQFDDIEHQAERILDDQDETGRSAPPDGPGRPGGPVAPP